MTVYSLLQQSVESALNGVSFFGESDQRKRIFCLFLWERLSSPPPTGPYYPSTSDQVAFFEQLDVSVLCPC